MMNPRFISLDNAWQEYKNIITIKPLYTHDTSLLLWALVRLWDTQWTQTFEYPNWPIIVPTILPVVMSSWTAGCLVLMRRSSRISIFVRYRIAVITAVLNRPKRRKSDKYFFPFSDDDCFYPLPGPYTFCKRKWTFATVSFSAKIITMTSFIWNASYPQTSY